MSFTLVSVIMAVRNGERFLQQAIESVLSQTYSTIEVIVIDGQSTDRTKEIACSFSNIRYLYQNNLGIPNAYNLGIGASQGELVAFLSHDDLWHPQKLSLQVAFLQDHPEMGYVIAQTEYFLETGCDFPDRFVRHDILEKAWTLRMMEIVLIRKWVFEKIGMFDPSLSTAEDIDWFSRADDADIRMGVIPETLLYKRIHDRNASIYSVGHRQNLLSALRKSAARKRRKAANGQST